MVKSWRWRLVLIASLALIVAGVALLVTSMLTPSAEPAVRDAVGGRVGGHDPGDPGAIVVPGVAVHPGPEVALLAAELTPDSRPALVLAVNVPSVATPVLILSPGAVAQDQ